MHLVVGLALNADLIGLGVAFSVAIKSLPDVYILEIWNMESQMCTFQSEADKIPNIYAGLEVLNNGRLAIREGTASPAKEYIYVTSELLNKC